MTTSPVRVLVADSDPLLGAAFRAGLEDNGLEIVACVDRSDDAVREARRLVPDVAVLAAELSPGDAVSTCAAIKASLLPVRVLIVSERPDQELLLAAVEAGTDGYLDRSGRLEALVSAIHKVHAGEACIPSAMLGVLLRSLIERRRDEDSAVERYSRLSPREKEVLALLAAGMDNGAIAEKLVVSRHTVRTHVQNVLEKLEVHSRMEVANLAMDFNLVERFVGKP